MSLNHNFFVVFLGLIPGNIKYVAHQSRESMNIPPTRSTPLDACVFNLLPILLHTVGKENSEQLDTKLTSKSSIALPVVQQDELDATKTQHPSHTCVANYT